MEMSENVENTSIITHWDKKVIEWDSLLGKASITADAHKFELYIVSNMKREEQTSLKSRYKVTKRVV